MSTSEQDLSKLNRQGALYSATISCTVLAVIAVVLRLFARRNSSFKYGVDDLLIVLSLGAMLAFTVGHLVVTAVGYGKPTIFVTNMHVFVSATVSNIVAYAIGTALTKISILCFYSRIFHSKTLNRVNWAVGIFVVLYNLALILVISLQCIPLSSTWTGKPGKCINTSPPFLALGVINFVTDIGILCIPIRFVLRLQMDSYRKVQTLGVFLTGAVVCAFGIVRVITLAGLEPGDPSYNMAWPGVWSFCEEAIGIVGACLPTLGSFVSKRRMTNMSYAVQKLISSKRHSPNDTSIMAPTIAEDEDGAAQKPGIDNKVTEMDNLSGRTMNSSQSVHNLPKTDTNDRTTIV